MACSSGVASANSILVAIRTAFERASETLRAPAQFAFVFVSGDSLSEKTSEILDLWQDISGGIPFFGGSAESVVGTRIEIEGGCAASIMLVNEMDALPRTYDLECIKTPDGPSVMGLTDQLLSELQGGLMVVACPVSFSVELLASALEYEKSSPRDDVVPILGGYCSSQDWQSPSIMFCGNRILARGAAVLTLPQNWKWQTIISQGCRPIGEPLVITQMDDQAIVSLGGKPAMKQLRELYEKLPTQEQEMVSNSLMVGRAISEYSETFSHGEFLIRAVQGIDPSNQGLIVTDRFQVGQTIRFHVRDAAAATADLQHLLGVFSNSEDSPTGALLFTCNGRGSRMFDVDNHDATTIDSYLPNLPLTGIFAAGEFGPIANQNLVHGFTAILHLLKKEADGDQPV
ncbi:MAG: FIST C-terminal domain-containing protein [Pirellula sp.]|nr:FIST C-terminal domain-containing protein [Pirellula sp.]